MNKEAEELRISTVEEDVRETKEAIKVIRENHLAHMQASLISIAADMEWVKKFLWLLIPEIIIANLIK